jgi:hypothetical protein
MLKPPRRIYVTHEEFERLQQLGQEAASRALFTMLPFRNLDDDYFVEKASALLDVSVETLKKYTWHVEVVSFVRQRVGRAWVSRGMAGRR